jgi:hypothetical protein
LLVQSGLPLAGGIIGSGGELSWLKPARPGDTLSVVSEIVEITPSRSRPDRGSVRVRSETHNQHGDVVQTFTARLVVPRCGAPQFDISGGALKIRNQLGSHMSERSPTYAPRLAPVRHDAEMPSARLPVVVTRPKLKISSPLVNVKSPSSSKPDVKRFAKLMIAMLASQGHLSSCSGQTACIQYLPHSFKTTISGASYMSA